MTAARTLQPTLWRTCRAIANRARLQMLDLLIQEPGLTVSAVASRMNQSLSVTSEYLRALEARGLLTVRRVKRRVEYRPHLATSVDAGPRLAAALRLTLEREAKPIENLFKLATAFTHPRRINIFRTLKNGSRTLGQIQAASGISLRALRRHLSKLEARGFVRCRAGLYSLVRQVDAFGCELARLVAE
jgi:DNA-binding transcriptional ArsR family regulator